MGQRLSVEGSANWDGSFNFQKVFNLPTYVYYKDSSTGELFEARSGRQSNQATLGETFSQFTRFTINTRINYEQSFGNHNINFLLGAEQMEENYNFLYGYRSNFPSTALSVIDAGSNDKNHQSNSGNATQFSRLNYFGRMTYDYKSKYLAQLILRYDGSPNFPETKRWGAFPGISVGWRISEEPFLNDLYFLDNLKLRASYGKMGNDNVAAFQYLMTYSYGNNYVLDNKDVTGLIQSGTPNPNITWEVAETSNIGFESLMWQGLLNIELDLFKTKRSNILTKRSAIVPSYTGLVLPDENIGIVENKGIELQLSHMNSINEFKYSINGNFSFARNKVVFSDEAPAAEDYQLATGRPIGSSLYYKSLGIFSSQNEIDSYPHLPGTRPGDIKYEDVNKDGEINSRDMIRINETNTPEIVYSLNTTFNYRNFDLSVLFQGQANANVYLGSYFTVMSYSLGNFSHIRARDYWSPDNTNATMPRPSLELWNNNTQVSTHYLFNSDFLRLKNLEFGYSLPQKLSQKLGINNLRLYVNGNNILLIYDHFRGTGFDPETNRYWFYPQQRTYNFGIDLTF